MMAKPLLYIVATPIGNLKDISLRALEILREADFILCEDTRVTRKLLEHYNIAGKRLISYHQHSKHGKVEFVIQLLREGKMLALVTDAGTPGISDPGGKLVEEIIKRDGKTEVVPIPGSSAVTAAASISGFPMDKFLFLGFPPTKRKRKKFFEEVTRSKYPAVFYESSHRIIKSLQELALEAKTRNLEPKIVVCRELTKKFETVYRGTPEEALERLEKEEVRGEFVVVVMP